ncbi:ABC transporter permease [Bacillus sp. B1-b2]|uniref:ABC transporter permease n=1 Tax=Bacillus sp. B1-b2 TaxID=2653201 RepID=UPI001261616A|nr:ABC transporter permease [Bacillus sp. B1-b2]KAB7673215.1 ABC transporter permease [Bacillus sp. B1-b2]
MWLPFTATFLRNYQVMKRAFPWSFFIGHILTGFYIIIFAYFTYYYVFKEELAGSFSSYSGTDDYLSYVILGGVLYSFSVSLLMIVSRAIITELREGTLEALLLSPSSRKGYFLGYVAQGLTRVIIEFLVIILTGYFFGLYLQDINWLNVLVVLLLLVAATFSQALVLGSFMLYFRDTYITQNTLFVLMGLVCSITFPVEFLPETFSWIGNIMPLTYGVDALRLTWIEGKSLVEIWPFIWRMIVIGIIYFPIGTYFIKKMEKSVLEKHFG